MQSFRRQLKAAGQTWQKVLGLTQSEQPAYAYTPQVTKTMHSMKQIPAKCVSHQLLKPGKTVRVTCHQSWGEKLTRGCRWLCCHKLSFWARCTVKSLSFEEQKCWLPSNIHLSQLPGPACIIHRPQPHWGHTQASWEVNFSVPLPKIS